MQWLGIVLLILVGLFMVYEAVTLVMAVRNRRKAKSKESDEDRKEKDTTE